MKEREKLRALTPQPHMLLMTATPIPRTMALVQFGEMMHSSITEMPPGRLPIHTTVVEDTVEDREEVGCQCGDGVLVLLSCSCLASGKQQSATGFVQGWWRRALS